MPSKLPEDAVRNVSIQCLVTKSEADYIRQVALDNDVTVSSLVRELLLPLA